LLSSEEHKFRVGALSGKEMFARRTLLGGGLGALGLGLSTTHLDPDKGLNPRDFGAVGNGLANDTTAVVAALRSAFRSRRPLDGGNAVFAVSGDIRLAGYTAPWIYSLRLRQLNPANDRKTLYLVGCEGIRVDRLEIDVGSSKSIGYMNESGGLWIDGGSRHKVSNVDVFGHGKNSLIAIWNTRSSIYTGLCARDAAFDDRDAQDDVLQGIWLNANTDCILQNAIASNLGGNASFRGKRFPNLRSRGIALGGNLRCDVIDPSVRDVDQGVDITGSEGNIGCAVVRGRAFQCTSAGLKFANSAENCRASGFVSERCGSQGFLISGPNEILSHFTSHIELSDCIAIDIGYNHFPTTSAGFMIQAGAKATGPLVHYPNAIRLLRCRALDTQAEKTLEYGFYTNIAQKPDTATPNELVDCESRGQTVAAQWGSWRVS
jgi:hypothetical protein